MPPIPVERGDDVMPSTFAKLTKHGKPGWIVAILGTVGAAGLGLSQVVTACTSGTAENIRAWRQPDAAREVAQLRSKYDEQEERLAEAVKKATKAAEDAKTAQEATEKLVSEATSRVARSLTDERAGRERLASWIKHLVAFDCRINGGNAYHPDLDKICKTIDWESIPDSGPNPKRLWRSKTPPPEW